MKVTVSKIQTIIELNNNDYYYNSNNDDSDDNETIPKQSVIGKKYLLPLC